MFQPVNFIIGKHVEDIGIKHIVVAGKICFVKCPLIPVKFNIIDYCGIGVREPVSSTGM